MINFQRLIQSLGYLEFFAWVFAYFFALYFLFCSCSLVIFKLLERNKVLIKADKSPLFKGQIFYEIKYSLVMIICLAFTGIFVLFLVKNSWVHFLNSGSTFNYLFDTLLLLIWSIVHFHIIHWLLHLPFFYRYTHFIHHKSIVPTVWNTYTAHWLEAFMLASSVPIFLIFKNVEFYALATFPALSFILNIIGHSNRKFIRKQNVHESLMINTHHLNHHLMENKPKL